MNKSTIMHIKPYGDIKITQLQDGRYVWQYAASMLIDGTAGLFENGWVPEHIDEMVTDGNTYNSIDEVIREANASFDNMELIGQIQKKQTCS